MFRSHGSGVARDVTTQASKVDGKVEGGQGLRGGPIQCVQSVCDECVMREHDSRIVFGLEICGTNELPRAALERVPEGFSEFSTTKDRRRKRPVL
jgi:hypothetical protein